MNFCLLLPPFWSFMVPRFSVQAFLKNLSYEECALTIEENQARGASK
jgi:hypothetical protein